MADTTCKEEYTYQIGKITFIVTPVYKDEGEPSFYGYDDYDSPVRLNNIATPTSDSHAANKQYVDDIVATAIGNIDTILDSINGEVA